MRFRVEILGWVEAESIEDALLKLGKHYVALVSDPDYSTSIWLPDSSSRMWVGEEEDGRKTPR